MSKRRSKAAGDEPKSIANSPMPEMSSRIVIQENLKDTNVKLSRGTTLFRSMQSTVGRKADLNHPTFTEKKKAVRNLFADKVVGKFFGSSLKKQ